LKARVAFFASADASDESSRCSSSWWLERALLLLMEHHALVAEWLLWYAHVFGSAGIHDCTLSSGACFAERAVSATPRADAVADALLPLRSAHHAALVQDDTAALHARRTPLRVQQAWQDGLVADGTLGALFHVELRGVLRHMQMALLAVHEAVGLAVVMVAKLAHGPRCLLFKRF